MALFQGGFTFGEGGRLTSRYLEIVQMVLICRLPSNSTFVFLFCPGGFLIQHGKSIAKTVSPVFWGKEAPVPFACNEGWSR